MPPLSEYGVYLQKIWESGQLTNNGPLSREFEKRASEYLRVKHLKFVANGTLALQLALEALDIREGEVITTPFSYVATTSAILWQRCRPVYVDIDPNTLCIDPDKIEAAITPKTKAILPVHVFGNPCDVEQIEEIAEKHNLKVIYDAAHAFGVTYKGRSLLEYGDASICSFHATKLFHTIEGGAVVSRSEETIDKVELIKRFGHNADDHITLGINAKASELHAAMGLVNLTYIDGIIGRRREAYRLYDELLEGKLDRPRLSLHTQYNYSYYPVIFDSESDLLDAVSRLADKQIYPRRYFFPSLNKLPYLEDTQECPVSEGISSRILCLPLSADLQEDAVRNICDTLKSGVGSSAIEATEQESQKDIT